MKVKRFYEYFEKQISDEDIMKNIKKDILDKGFKIKDVKELSVYVKPEENKVFYYVSEKLNGYVDLY